MSSMSGTNQNKREIFLRALEKSAAEREAFLVEACHGDSALRRSVEELLCEQADVDGSFLETPAIAPETPAGPHGTALIEPVTERPGDRIGRYKLLQKIGEGGCGVVYMAEQEVPVRRRVAVKVIKLGMDTKSVIARFEAERQALALMDHPNIAKVLDAGATETGRPYFVMELVKGTRITDYCDENNLSTNERLLLFIQVCHAIQHAHQKGIIHRDIKPSNILVALHDVTPVPKIIDFGIAKATEQRLTERTLFTEFTAFIGTPAYMSPEQAAMSGLDIDTRSDIYSLGVLLYELLTGKTPFDAEALYRLGLDECRRTIREKEPARPSTRLSTMMDSELTTAAHHRRTESARLIHLLEGDLDWVVMKCLEKDRTRRYAAASGLALDVQRYLNNEPVEARPPSNWYRLQKMFRRNRTAFAAAAGIAAALVAGVTISTWQAVRAVRAERQALDAQEQEVHLRQQAEAERERAERERASSRINEYVADINLAKQSFDAGNLRRAQQLLEKHLPKAGEQDLRGFEWRYLRQLCRGDEHVEFAALDSPVSSLAWSADGRWVAAGADQSVVIYDALSRATVTNLAKGGYWLAFMPDSRRLIAASSGTVRVWNTQDWTEEKALAENTGPIALTTNARRLATVNREGVRLWDTEKWESQELVRGLSGPIALSRDGRLLAGMDRAGLVVTVLGDGSRRVMSDSTNLFFPRLPGARFRGNRVDNALVFSPDGRFIVAARNSLTERGVFLLSAWNVENGEELVIQDQHTGMISSMIFSPDGNTLATASLDHSIRLWDFKNSRLITDFQGHANEVWSVAFAPDGLSIVSGAKDGAIKLWPIRTESREDIIPGNWQTLSFSPDSKRLAAVNRERDLVFLNMMTREPEQEFELGTPAGRDRFRFGSAIAVSSNLRTAAYAVEEGAVQLLNTETRETTTLPGVEGRFDNLHLALSSDGLQLVTSGLGARVRLWDLRHATNIVLAGDASRILFSPDDRTLAIIRWGGAIQLWDLATRTLRTNVVAEIQGSPGTSGIAFSPDGRTLAVICRDDAIRLYDAFDAELLGTCIGHKQTVLSVAFSPEGRTLATVSEDSTLKLWNTATQQELLTIRRLGGSMRELLFSPDGQMLVGTRGLMSRIGGLRFYRAPHEADPTPP